MKKRRPNYADLQIVEVPINALCPPEYYNRVEIESKKLFFEKSIIEYGLIVPLLVNTSNDRANIIIDGVARWEVCKSLGYEKIPVLLTCVPKEDELQQHIISNEQARKFYREFIEGNLTPDLLDALIQYYAKDEEAPSEAPLKEIKSTSDMGNETTKFNIAILIWEAKWFDKMKPKLGCKNRSQVIQFLIKNYKENENNKTK